MSEELQTTYDALRVENERLQTEVTRLAGELTTAVRQMLVYKKGFESQHRLHQEAIEQKKTTLVGPANPKVEAQIAALQKELARLQLLAPKPEVADA